MNIEVILTGIVGLITTIVSGWTSWFFARKKYNSEVDNQVITNMKESLEFYKTLSDDNKVRLNEVLLQNKEILDQNARLLDQNTKLEAEVKELKSKVETLTTRIGSIRTNKKAKKNE